MARTTTLPHTLNVRGKLVTACKAENEPLGPAGLYSLGSRHPLAIPRFKLLEGAKLSLNNWCDVGRALSFINMAAQVLWRGKRSRISISAGIKHGNPCGAGVAKGRGAEFVSIRKTLLSDLVSIYGGTFICTFRIDVKEAKELVRFMVKKGKRNRIFDLIIAPEITEAARAILRRNKGACKMLVNPALGDERCAKSYTGRRGQYAWGALLEQKDYSMSVVDWNDPELQVVGPPLTPELKRELELALIVCGCSNSNTITLTRKGMVIGNGVGQQSRVDAARLAVRRARSRRHVIKGGVAASDSFFPFLDAAWVLVKAGIRAIVGTQGGMQFKKIQAALAKAGVTFVTVPDSKGRRFSYHTI